MKYYFLIALFLFAPCSTWAQSNLINPRVIVEGEILRGEFTEERHLKDFKAPLRSSGHFVIAPGYGLIWSVEKPFAITTVITPSGLVQKVNGNQTMNLAANRIPFLLHLYEMLGGTLAGNWSALSQQFDVAKTGSETHWQVQLTPLRDDPAMPFNAIVANGTEFVQQVELRKIDGDTDNLKFLNQKLSTAPLSASEVMLLKPAP